MRILFVFLSSGKFIFYDIFYYEHTKGKQNSEISVENKILKYMEAKKKYIYKKKWKSYEKNSRARRKERFS